MVVLIRLWRVRMRMIEIFRLARVLIELRVRVVVGRHLRERLRCCVPGVGPGDLSRSMPIVDS